MAKSTGITETFLLIWRRFQSKKEVVSDEESGKVQNMARFLIYFYWALLTYSLLAPAPLWFLTGINQEDEYFVLQMSDLIQHASTFCVLGFLLSTQLQAPAKVNKRLYTAGVYAVATELLQWFIPHRFAATSDMLANITGLFLGWGLFLLMRSLLSNRTPSFQVR